MSQGAQSARRVLAIADSDSYLKWSWAISRSLPADWLVEQLLINSPIAPSAQQVADVTPLEITRLSAFGLLVKIARERPDVVILACTGPVVRTLLDLPILRRRNRPVLVSGLPGIAIAASERALRLRAGVDLFVVHSLRERAEFAALAAQAGIEVSFSLTTLPFAGSVTPAEAAGPGSPAAESRRRVIFAAQAKVPVTAADRGAILCSLAELSSPLSGVVKLRALAGEEQTHREEWPYPQLWQQLLSQRAVAAGAVEFVGGSMTEALKDAAALVTVSSTAAVEAIAAQVPVLILTDFGVDEDMINTVFEGSGLFGDLGDLRAGRFFHPDPSWLTANYFHPADRNDLVYRLVELVELREKAGLGPVVSGPADGPSRRIYRWLRLLAPRSAPLIRRWMGPVLRLRRRRRAASSR